MSLPDPLGYTPAGFVNVDANGAILEKDAGFMIGMLLSEHSSTNEKILLLMLGRREAQKSAIFQSARVDKDNQKSYL
jgi:hypothetical protein